MSYTTLSPRLRLQESLFLGDEHPTSFAPSAPSEMPDFMQRAPSVTPVSSFDDPGRDNAFYPEQLTTVRPVSPPADSDTLAAQRLLPPAEARNVLPATARRFTLGVAGFNSHPVTHFPAGFVPRASIEDLLRSLPTNLTAPYPSGEALLSSVEEHWQSLPPQSQERLPKSPYAIVLITFMLDVTLNHRLYEWARRNQAEAGMQFECLREYAWYVDRALEHLPAVPCNVFRATAQPPKTPQLFTSGAPLIYGSLMSASADLSAALGSVPGKPRVVLLIHSRRARDVSFLSLFPEQGEYIFPLNSKLRSLRVLDTHARASLRLVIDVNERRWFDLTRATVVEMCDEDMAPPPPGHFVRSTGKTKELARSLAVHETAQDHCELGQLLADHSVQYAVARKHFERAIELDRNYSQPHVSLGRLLTNRYADHDGARFHFEEALRINPADAAAHNSLAWVMEWRLGNKHEARYHYEQALQLDPNLAFAHANLARLLATHSKEPDRALSHYNAALQLNPNEASTHAGLALLLTTHFGEHQEARRHFEEALRLNPKDGVVHYQLARLLTSHIADKPVARYHYEKAVELDSNDSRAHYNLALLLSEGFDDSEGARREYLEALRLDPSLAEAHNNLALLLAKSFNDYSGARHHFDEAIRINPQYTRARNNYGNLLKDCYRDYPGARAQFTEVLNLKPKSQAAQRGLQQVAQLERLTAGTHAGVPPPAGGIGGSTPIASASNPSPQQPNRSQPSVRFVDMPSTAGAQAAPVGTGNTRY